MITDVLWIVSLDHLRSRFLHHTGRSFHHLLGKALLRHSHLAHSIMAILRRHAIALHQRRHLAVTLAPRGHRAVTKLVRIDVSARRVNATKLRTRRPLRLQPDVTRPSLR